MKLVYGHSYRGALVMLGAFLVLMLPVAWGCASDVPRIGDVGAVLRLAVERAGPVPVSPPALPDDPWRRVQSPTKTPAESIGGYAAGCLRGAAELEQTGQGFQVMRPSRRRFFGHPRLIDLVRSLGQGAAAQGLGTLLVGDLGQPRGGPTMNGHASHQTGLDVDVWFLQIAGGRMLSPEERESLSSPSLVVRDFEGLSAAWDPKEIDVLALAASDPAVDRIFVNPVIKKAVCELHKGEAWLSKLRPWWGHDDHFHARLRCAPQDVHCEAQEPVLPGDGCDATLEDWFTAETKAKAKHMREHPEPATMPTLPPLCRTVLTE